MSERRQSVDALHGFLQKRLSTLSTLAMAFAILNTWIALAGSIGLILPSGGSVAFLYGFLFCVACSFCVAASLGELAAIWPTAGGQYHYVFALCTERWRKPVSFFVGWTNIAGWLIVVTVQGYFAAQFISAAIVVASNDSYQITLARTYGIFLAVLSSTTAINIWGNSVLGKWNTGALYWSILGALVLSIVLLATCPKTDAKYVFTDFRNETNWPDGIAWILGLLQSALSLTAFDVVLHMTEEMPNPRRDAPRALIYAIAVGGVTGLLLTLVILFCLADPTSILTAPGNMPIVAMILQATKSRAAAAIISLMLSVCFINGSSASITSVSRLLFAMARDRGIIFHDFFGYITPRLNVPTRAIAFLGGRHSRQLHFCAIPDCHIDFLLFPDRTSGIKRQYELCMRCARHLRSHRIIVLVSVSQQIPGAAGAAPEQPACPAALPQACLLAALKLIISSTHYQLQPSSQHQFTMFATLPDFTPRDSHSLWYTSSRAPILGGLPDGPGHDAANHGHHHGPSGQQQQQHPHSARQRGQILERTALARLAADEAHMQRRRVSVQNYGSTWLKPPGIPKTLHQMREEKREQEEHQEAMRREQLAQELAEAEAEAAAAAGEDGEEAMDDVQLDGAQDLDEEIPDADDEFALGGGSDSEDEDDDDDDDDDRDEEGEEEEGEADVSAAEEAMREERRNDLMAARMRMTDDAFREALVRGDPDGDDMYGGGEELDERGQGHMLDEEDFVPSSMLDGEGDEYVDLGMDANLDDDIPEAEEEEAGYEHTDSDAALSSDDRRDDSSEQDDDDDIGFAPRAAPLAPPLSPTLRGQQQRQAQQSHHRHRRSTGAASTGPRSSMDLSAFLSQDESSFMDSSPVQGRRNMRG
ncbi:hypothetical protein PWT90_06825 [Aphanocladium album]|nr:hypothetical protein PWT90_06825 [Aphanocladium album]